MSDTADDQTHQDPPYEGEEFIDAQPDRPPTPDEETAADRGALDVDIDDVGGHFQEMTERGANVKGEGQIEPT